MSFVPDVASYAMPGSEDAEPSGGASSRRTSSAAGEDPALRRAVYNLYRGMLGTYNDKANDIISSLPPEQVREDQGIGKQVESMM